MFGGDSADKPTANGKCNMRPFWNAGIPDGKMLVTYTKLRLRGKPSLKLFSLAITRSSYLNWICDI